MNGEPGSRHWRWIRSVTGRRLRFRQVSPRAGGLATASFDAASNRGTTRPDFNFRQMRGNAVLRWEYRPRSTLFIVWNQSRTAYLAGPTEQSFAFNRDVDRLFNGDDAFPTPVTNVLLVKPSFWLNP